MPRRAWGWAGVSTPEQARSERESIPAQCRDIESAARRLSLDLHGILKVPGFSRDYIDWHEMRADMARQGIDAPARLEALWQARAIDVFICRDADRFGRTLPVLSYIGAQLIAAGARIYLTAKDMFIDRANFNTLIALFGLIAADEIDRLRARYALGMAGRLRRNLPGTRLPLTHVYAGPLSARTLVIDESLRRLWDDLAELLLAGLSFDSIALEIARRGHRHPRTGRPIEKTLVWRIFHNPFTWGHVAHGHHRLRGAWCYDESCDPPEGVRIQRDVIPPVWRDDQADRIRAELRRRETALAGRARAEATHRYTGLLRCAACGYSLIWHTAGYYYCGQISLHKRRREAAPVCPNRTYLRQSTADAQVRAFLERLLALPSLVLPAAPDQPSPSHVAAVQAEIAATESRITSLIRLQADAPAPVVGLYSAQIAEAADLLDQLRAEATRLSALAESPTRAQSRHTAFGDLAHIGLDALFAGPDRAINQLLHRLLSGYTFRVQDGAIISLERIPHVR